MARTDIAHPPHALQLPQYVLVVRKLGAPNQPDLAMGAIAAGGVVVLNPGVTRGFSRDPATIDAVIERERYELERREQTYRKGRAPLAIKRARSMLRLYTCLPLRKQLPGS